MLVTVMNAESYIKQIVRAAEGLAELADRDRYSPTYGCFSYPFWRSKSSDYANARCQEAAYALALLYKGEYPESKLRGCLQWGELARAGMLFWAAGQHKDGSFDEWYKGEHGFAATAFSSFALSRAYLLLEDDLSGGERERLLPVFRSAARWLCRHDDLSKINHQAVAAAALYSLAEILRDDNLARKADKKLDSVLSRQTAEGWFPELGGLDTGYSFLTLEYLAQCYVFRGDEKLKAAIKRALEFLIYFVHPDITTGREYNLCGNSYVSLLAGAIMAEFSPSARRLFREGVSRGNVLAQLAQDDLSRCYHLYNGLSAYDFYRKNLPAFEKEAPPLPYGGKPFQKYFPGAGLLAVRGGNYYALAGCKYGGMIKIFPDPGQSRENEIGGHDSGYTIGLKSGLKLHSSRLAPDNKITLRPDGTLEVIASFRPGSYFFPHPLARFLLQAAGLFPGGYLLIKKGIDFIRRRKKASFQLLAVSGKASSWKLKRTVSFREESTRVVDEISAGEGAKGASAAIELELRKGGLVIGRPGAAWEEELRKQMAFEGRALIEKTITCTRSEVNIKFK